MHFEDMVKLSWQIIFLSYVSEKLEYTHKMQDFLCGRAQYSNFLSIGYKEDVKGLLNLQPI